jgi:alpha-1,6-mannosyltransferase
MVKAAESLLASGSRFRRALALWAVPITLLALGVVSASLYYWARDLHRFIQWVAAYISLFIGQFAIYLIGCFVVIGGLRGRPRKVKLVTVALVILFAAVFRAELVAQRPYLSTDVYRYIWDGRVQSAGINPYRYIPNAEQLKPLEDDKIFPQINRGDYAPTPYPPIAQAIYLGVYLVWPLSVTAFKIAMSLFDMLTVLAVMLALKKTGNDPARAIIFAWHPLLIFESAHSGHVEAPFVAFLALALLAWSYKKPTLTGAAVGLAAMVKFYPALLLPVFFFPLKTGALQSVRSKASQWARGFFSTLFSRPNLLMLFGFVAVVVLSYLPYLTVGLGVFGSLPNEFREEGFTDSGARYFLLVLLRQVMPVPTTFFLVIAALVLVGLGVWWMVRVKRDATDVARGAVTLIGVYLFITTPRYSWYYAWILPFLCFAPRIAWVYLTGASVLLYTLWYIPFAYPDLPLWLGSALFVPTLAFVLWEWKRRGEDAHERPVLTQR